MKKNKLLSGLFVLLLVLSVTSVVFAFPITGRVITVSSTETTITQGNACATPICADDVQPVDTGKLDSNECHVYACKTDATDANVCCESFGYGARMIKTPSSYAMMPRSKCTIEPGFVGGGKNIVDNSFCTQTNTSTCVANNGACCVGDVCVRTTADCTNGNTPQFKGCSDSCKPVVECVADDRNIAACAICAGGTDTGMIDDHGCPIMICPTAPTPEPIGACSRPICSNDSTPVDTGKVDSNKCTIYTCPIQACPENCVCNDQATTCPTVQGKPIEVEIATSQGPNTISVGKGTNDAMIITEGKTAVSTSTHLVIEDKKLMMNTTQGTKEIKIMPSTASETAINQLQLKNYQIELKDVGQPVYEITGTKDVKVMGIFNAQMLITSSVDATTGSVGVTAKPWWSFLAKE